MLHHIAIDPPVPSSASPPSERMKRALDLALTVPFLLLALPVLGLIALVIFCRLGRPILFQQVRPGYKAVPFTLYKFRTMSETKSKIGDLLPDSARLEAVGKFLRRTSLDELPGLINVLRGDMSLVGPRPLLMEYLPRYSVRQALRHEVKPGITGWAQVNGRNTLTWQDQFELDIWYVEHHTLWLDLKVLSRTLWKVISGEGVNEPGQATRGKFTDGAE